jgi:hypothetical protein
MRRSAALVLGASLALGCASGFNRGEMESSLRAADPVFTDATVEEIAALQPQIRLPITIAVSQPLGGTVGAWTNAEIEEIESWGPALAGKGIAQRVSVVPSTLLRGCALDGSSCSLGEQREAAARIGADTLLVMNDVTAVDAYPNPGSLLNLTILGMWLVPGHHRDALTLVEGILVDNRNEYVYALARAEGQASQVRPNLYVDEAEVMQQARLAALKAFGPELVAQVSQLRTR